MAHVACAAFGSHGGPIKWGYNTHPPDLAPEPPSRGLLRIRGGAIAEGHGTALRGLRRHLAQRLVLADVLLARALEEPKAAPATPSH
jgi:hypothetical protein